MAHLDAAVRALAALPGSRVVAESGRYETAPVGRLDQPAFVNMAVELDTAYDPPALLDAVKQVETELGREPGERWGPRTVDIDMVLFGDRIIESDRLTVPHREFRNRAFVLVPLAEIAPDAVDPVTGCTIAQLVVQPALREQGVRRLV